MTVFNPSFPPVSSMTTKMGESGLGSAAAATRCHKCGNGNPRDITDVLATRVRKSRRVCITIHLRKKCEIGNPKSETNPNTKTQIPKPRRLFGDWDLVLRICFEFLASDFEFVSTHLPLRQR